MKLSFLPSRKPSNEQLDVSERGAPGLLPLKFLPERTERSQQQEQKGDNKHNRRIKQVGLEVVGYRRAFNLSLFLSLVFLVKLFLGQLIEPVKPASQVFDIGWSTSWFVLIL